LLAPPYLAAISHCYTSPPHLTAIPHHHISLLYLTATSHCYTSPPRPNTQTTSKRVMLLDHVKDYTNLFGSSRTSSTQILHNLVPLPARRCNTDSDFTL